jgi:hypothetical protein
MGVVFVINLFLNTLNSYFYSKTNQVHNISSLFYFGTTPYMLRTVPSFIIKSLKTVHTTSGICHIGSGGCLLAGTRWNWPSILFFLASSHQNLYGIYLMLYVQS